MSPSRDQLIDLILRETTDKVTADGVQIAAPNILEVGCRYVRGDPRRGYENPAEAARQFAGFIADAVLSFAPVALTAGKRGLPDQLRGMAREFMETMDEAQADVLIRAAVALETRTQPVAETTGKAAAWAWTRTGADIDGDPLTIKGQFGDYDACVTLSRTTRTWSSTVNNGHGRLDYATEDEARAYAEQTVRDLLSVRLVQAEATMKLYAPHPDAYADKLRMAGEALEVAHQHIQYMAAWITKTNASDTPLHGYSFEALGEDKWIIDQARVTLKGESPS